MNRKLALGAAATSTLVVASAALAVGANFGLFGLAHAGSGLSLPVANTEPIETPLAVAPESTPDPEPPAELEPEIVEEIRYVDVPTPVKTVYVEVPAAVPGGPAAPAGDPGPAVTPERSSPPAPEPPAPVTTVAPSTVTTGNPTTTTTAAEPTTTTTRPGTTTTTEHEDDDEHDDDEHEEDERDD